MASGLLYVYSEPGPVPEAEYTDWYDNEHVPSRLTVPGISNARRFRAADGRVPTWLATYDLAPGTLDSPEYKALAENASAREKSIMSSLGTLDRRVYEVLDTAGAAWAPGDPDPAGPPPVLLAVGLSVPPSLDADLAAWYADEHIPMLLAVPGWGSIRRYRLTEGTAPTYLALHDLASLAVFDDPAYQAAVTTPWRNRIMDSATAVERRVFSLYRAWGA
jgi:hypothetical protein